MAPDLKFHRAIGEFAGQPYSVTGELLSPEGYAEARGRGPAERGGEDLRPEPDAGAGLDRAARNVVTG